MVNKDKIIKKFKQEYPKYPKGVEGFSERSREPVVEVELEEELDREKIVDIIQRNGYTVKFDEHKVVNYYREENHLGETNILVGTIHIDDSIPIANEDRLNRKIKIIIQYLTEKYN